MATAEFYLKQWQTLIAMAAASDDPAAAAALRIRAAEYLTIARALADSGTSPQMPIGTQQQQAQPSTATGEQQHESAGSYDGAKASRLCQDCGRAMRLTALRPAAHYTNLDECDVVCDSCGKSTTFYVARHD